MRRLVVVAVGLLVACGGGDGEVTGGDGDGDGDGDVDIDVGCEIFPSDNWWNQDVSQMPLHPMSDTYVDSIGRSANMHPDFGTDFGIPFVVVPGTTPLVPVSFDAFDESDPGPYPIPDNAPVEDSGDAHVLVIDNDDCVLYELAAAARDGEGWTAYAGAVFDLSTNELRPDRWTSADAAGLPIFAGLVRYSEVVEDGVIDHALRFTVPNSQSGYIEPATHAAGSDDSSLPPMGLRVRMKAGYDCSAMSSEAQVVCTALKTYGMFVADNGSSWYLSGAPDARWSNENLGDLKDIPGDAFEVVDTGSITPW